MKKAIVGLVLSLLLAMVITPVLANPVYDPNPKRSGWVHWVWIEVEWTPDSDWASWYVYAYDCSGNPPKAQGADYGDLLASTDTAWLMTDFEYDLIGSTLQFDEAYVSGVIAHPQENHVVLHDRDGDGVYTGSDTTSYEFVSGRDEYLFLDVIMYAIEIDPDTGDVVHYYYEEHEYYKLVEEE